MVKKYLVLCDHCLTEIELPGQQYYTVNEWASDGIVWRDFEIHLHCLRHWATTQELDRNKPTAATMAQNILMANRYGTPMTPGTSYHPPAEPHE